MSVNLENIVNLVKDLCRKTTHEFMNETANCDDNNWKISLVNYKIYSYGHKLVEEAVNSSRLMFHKTVTESFYSIDKNIITKAQQNTCNSIFDLCSLIVEYYRQYVMTNVVAVYIKLSALVTDLKNIQGLSCDCSGSKSTTTACKI
jgi:hypothetical protein